MATEEQSDDEDIDKIETIDLTDDKEIPTLPSMNVPTAKTVAKRAMAMGRCTDSATMNGSEQPFLSVNLASRGTVCHCYSMWQALY